MDIILGLIFLLLILVSVLVIAGISIAKKEIEEVVDEEGLVEEMEEGAYLIISTFLQASAIRKHAEQFYIVDGNRMIFSDSQEGFTNKLKAFRQRRFQIFAIAVPLLLFFIFSDVILPTAVFLLIAYIAFNDSYFVNFVGKNPHMLADDEYGEDE